MPVPELPGSSFPGTLPKSENENIDAVLIINGSGAWLWATRCGSSISLASKPGAGLRLFALLVRPRVCLKNKKFEESMLNAKSQ